ncbi:MAG: ferrous iron transport protein A [Phycisphaerae bacterium]|jgi:Fe2+ transport system protein FeoA|nr:ferrous iron transport protein A [Phycisphaerae bacterium]MCZ2399531.1 ferrous iron transport protein A [Phycisphaerae bacterium]NUQ50607.1 ferrous iron transport protein A [Phycisphaerae bacterium]
MSLARAPLSTSLRIRAVRHDGPVGVRLMEMGLIEGAIVQVLGRAPLGDPLRVRLGTCELSLRGSEAELVDIVRE